MTRERNESLHDAFPKLIMVVTAANNCMPDCVMISALLDTLAGAQVRHFQMSPLSVYMTCLTDLSSLLVCWQRCDTSQTDCGMGCAESAEECGSVIADQVIAPLVLAANIASLGLGGPGTTALAKVGKTHKAITKLNNVLKSSTLKNSIDAFEAIDGVQDVLKVYKRLKPARVGLSVIDTADSINTYAQEGKTIYDAANDFSTSFSSEFAELTNQEIADEMYVHLIHTLPMIRN